MRPSRKIEDLGISDLCPVMVELSMAGTAWPMQLKVVGIVINEYSCLIRYIRDNDKTYMYAIPVDRLKGICIKYREPIPTKGSV